MSLDETKENSGSLSEPLLGERTGTVGRPSSGSNVGFLLLFGAAVLVVLLAQRKATIVSLVYLLALLVLLPLDFRVRFARRSLYAVVAVLALVTFSARIVVAILCAQHHGCPQDGGTASTLLKLFGLSAFTSAGDAVSDLLPDLFVLLASTCAFFWANASSGPREASSAETRRSSGGSQPPTLAQLRGSSSLSDDSATTEDQDTEGGVNAGEGAADCFSCVHGFVRSGFHTLLPVVAVVALLVSGVLVATRGVAGG